jgi:hypothetical protein
VGEKRLQRAVLTMVEMDAVDVDRSRCRSHTQSLSRQESQIDSRQHQHLVVGQVLHGETHTFTPNS